MCGHNRVGQHPVYIKDCTIELSIVIESKEQNKCVEANQFQKVERELVC